MSASTVLEFLESNRNPVRKSKGTKILYYVVSNVQFQCSKPSSNHSDCYSDRVAQVGCSILTTPSLLVAFIVRDSRTKLGMISATS